jgi:hypothetical protein
MTARATPSPANTWSDAAIAGVLALLAALASYSNAGRFDPVAYQPETGDVFFSADVPRVLANMTDHRSNHYRTGVHPLFPFATYPAIRLLRDAGFDAITAVRMLIAVIASLWAALLFTLLRRMGCRRIDALAFTGLALTSAAALFWFAVPETYGLGAVTILLALLFASEAEHRQRSNGALVALNIVTMGMTLTNWMAAIFTTLVLRRWRESLRIAAVAFAVVVVLSAGQRALFSSARLPFHLLREDLTVYTRSPSLSDAGRVALSFAVESVVLPQVQFMDNAKRPQWPKMRVGAVGWVGPLGTLAAAIWILMLALGAFAFAGMREHRGLRLALVGTLAGQLALHLVYGNETFLYALHWVGLLMVVAAASTLTRARPLALLLCVALLATAGLNNTALLRDAAAYFGADESERNVIAETGLGRHK